MKFILQYLFRYKKLLLINAISVFGFALVELGIPTIIADMIDVGVANQDHAYIVKMGIVIAIISLIGVGGSIVLGYCTSKISTNITRDLRNDIFEKAQTFTHTQMHKFQISSMITRTNNDPFQIQMFVLTILRTAMLTPVMFIVSFIMTIRASVQLSLIIAATIPFVILGVIWVAKTSEPISEQQQRALDDVNRIAKENLTGIRVIRAFNNSIHETKRFDEANVRFMKQSKKLFILMSMTQPTFFLLMNIAALLIFWFAAQMIEANQLQVGMLVAFMEYLFHAMLSIMLFCLVFVMYPRAAVSAKRIKEILDEPKEEEKGTQAVSKESGTLEFDHVTFVYPDGDEAVLKDVSFCVKKGETIALIGSTGSGKSTLIHLIPHFYDVTSGSIRIDGIDVNDYDPKVLRNKIGFIPQKAVLFTGTIADNIRFGKEDATMEEIIKATKTAQAYDFIMEKPLQFEEMVSENATNLSGGQKQRLSIARALVRKPDIYIFDDSFSALDFKTDSLLRQALRKEVKDSIVCIVAQRISSIMDADLIVVLNEGKVVGMGKHQELLKNCAIYQEIALSQLSEEELNNEK